MLFENSNEIAIMDNVFLVDTYSGQTVDLKNVSSYLFTVSTSLAQSSGPNRFYILISNTNPLPVELLSFGAVLENNKVVLSWATASEQNASHFEVQKSTDGKKFELIATVKSSNEGNRLSNYQFIDGYPSNINYYRLKQVDIDGSYRMSDVKVVSLNNSSIQLNNVKADPNPFTNKISISLDNGSAILSVRIYDQFGKLIETIDGRSLPSINIDATDLDTGIYIFSVTDTKGYVSNVKTLKN
jgi:hypothetical protein